MTSNVFEWLLEFISLIVSNFEINFKRIFVILFYNFIILTIALVSNLMNRFNAFTHIFILDLRRWIMIFLNTNFHAARHSSIPLRFLHIHWALISKIKEE